MDYKDTLELPSTEFPMRGNLAQNEPKTYNKWKQDLVYSKMLENRQGCEEFNLHDGPPYANGHLHIGHSLNKILKDFIVKYHYFNGKKVYYTPGWDCHGLPIEQKVEEKIGKGKKETLPKVKIRELCREWATNFVKIQGDEFQSLGVVGDFDKPYKTMEFAFEADIYKALCEIAKNGLLLERSKPVFWSWAAKSALAEAEVEYQDKEDYSIFVAFELKKDSVDKLNISGIDSIKAVFWTTTPWTLPANQAIALNPNEMYVITKEGYILAKELLSSMVDKGITKGEILCEYKGSHFENLVATNPLNNRDSRLILGEHVLMSGGSGLVHSAPGHGEDDYYVCLKYDIPVIMPVDDGGLYDNTLKTQGLLKEDIVDEFIGMHIFKANERILELLGDNLLHSSKFVHSYPFCWRTHKPVIYRATKQWFILMDKPFFEGKTLREIALSELDKTRFYPEHGKNRIYSMIENRPDWCISRQRDWGVPIAFFNDKESGEPVLDKEVLDYVADIFYKDGCDAWWEREIVELLPESWKHKAQTLEKSKHILDVWFDSGSTWKAVLQSGNYNSGNYPASMYLEGSDQHRGWFQSSLLISCAINHKAPFKNIVTHGFTMDEHGEKMSKSKGNVIAPQEILKEHGSEILRLWVAMSDYQNDQRISKNILKQVGENYRKIRNTIRFLLANTNGLDELYYEFSEIDLWILESAKKCFDSIHALLGEYEFAKAIQELTYFLNAELSGIYLDICKDNLYCNAIDSKERLASQSVMALIASRLFALLAPILTYTIDEALGYTKSKALLQLCNGGDSVFDIIYSPMPSFATPSHNFESLLEFRSLFLEQIDILKKDSKIKSTLEVDLLALNNTFKELHLWLMVSNVTNSSNEEILGTFSSGGMDYKIVKASGKKCPRCWQYLSKEEDKPCPRCDEVLSKKCK
ncbi:isoleucine--tRNA ligase [Helicobacter sp. WB40]|uniref:isoleucine--tRNA ligase n=1 Tax=Helicobacter sp. WB40 TaxID=3004130 RepID=UPI0022EBF923|nr:isoleucine--tRNA ligase [Helicobacter sp. WB40]MDA3967755.1 isoleucine--tRNA ligase [Helicobacter sp. WB40]